MLDGLEANAQIAGAANLLTMTPYESIDLSVVWRCGSAPPPGGGALLMGTSAGGLITGYLAPSVPPQYLPSACRL